MLHQFYTHPLLPKGSPPMPKLCRIPAGQTSYSIDPIAFLGALILAPLIPVLLTSPFLLTNNGAAMIGAIPLGAVYIGGGPYLIFGIPALLYVLSTKGTATGAIVDMALRVVFGLLLLNGALAVIFAQDAVILVPIIGVFALLFAWIWAALFARLYRTFERQAYRDRNRRA